MRLEENIKKIQRCKMLRKRKHTRTKGEGTTERQRPQRLTTQHEEIYQKALPKEDSDTRCNITSKIFRNYENGFYEQVNRKKRQEN